MWARISLRAIVGLVAIALAFAVVLSDDNQIAGLDLVELCGFCLVIFFVLKEI